MSKTKQTVKTLRTARLLLTVLPFLVSVGLVVLLGSYSQGLQEQQRESDRTAALQESKLLSTVLGEHVERSFEQADVLARMIAQRVVETGFKLDLPELAKSGAIPLDVFVQVAIIDDTGMMRATTVENSAASNLSDREHVKVHLQDPLHGPFLSKPLLGRASGKWSIQYSRAILNAKQELLGVVVVSIDPKYFSGFYQQIQLGEHGSVSLLGVRDRTLRARRTGGEFSAGQEVPANSPLFTQLASAPAGAYRGESSIDHRTRYYGYSSLDKYPFAVIVGLDEHDVMQLHAAERDTLLRGVLLVSAVILVMGAIGTAGVIRVFKEADARTVARDDARRLADQLSTVIDAVPDGMVLVDATLRVAVTNPAFIELSGLDKKFASGAQLQELLDAWTDSRGFDTHLDAASLRATLTSTLPGSFDAMQRIVIARRVPPQQVVELRARHVADGGDGFVLLARDITHESEIDRMKSEFIATAAHELRTPMASIHGFTELLASGRVPEDRQKSMLSIIHRQSLRMTAMLNDMLDLARIEARSGLDFQFEVVDLRDVVSGVYEEFGYMSNDRQIVRNLPAEPISVRCDRGKLAQAVRNLISNALKFSHAPAPVAICVECSRDGKQASVEVRDAGMGMTSEQQAELFKRFYRADKSGNIQGTGLGLSLVKTIVELHGGKVRIESTEDVGTSAFIDLPTADMPETREAAIEEAVH
jgi:signal transduction histidine kinase